MFADENTNDERGEEWIVATIDTWTVDFQYLVCFVTLCIWTAYCHHDLLLGENIISENKLLVYHFSCLFGRLPKLPKYQKGKE